MGWNSMGWKKSDNLIIGGGSLLPPCKVLIALIIKRVIYATFVLTNDKLGIKQRWPIRDTLLSNSTNKTFVLVVNSKYNCYILFLPLNSELLLEGEELPIAYTELGLLQYGFQETDILPFEA